MLVLTSLAAYQAGYIMLPICMVAYMPISLLFIVTSLFANEFPSIKSHVIVYTALTFITSALLQNNLLLLFLTALTLLVIATQPYKEQPITNPLSFIFYFIFLTALNNLVFGHILSSVFSLVGIERWAITLFVSAIEILSQTQEPTHSRTNVHPSMNDHKASFSFSTSTPTFNHNTYTCQASVNTQPEAAEQCYIM